ncbi:MAG: GPW/gp25 family protein [Flavobacteriales bacterium]
MNGINATTGKQLSGIKHLRQSVIDILITPLGSRVMRPEYGSKLFELVDTPVNKSWFIECYAAVAEALDKWEKRLKLTRISVVAVTAGRPIINIYGIYIPSREHIKLEGLAI